MTSLRDREMLLKHFRGSTALRDGAEWYRQAYELLARLALHQEAQPTQSNDIKRVLDLSIIHIRRYLFALSSMSLQHEDGSFSHLIDGYHAIHKSLFETYIEFAVSATYLSVFSNQGDPQGLSLTKRLQLHAEITSLKKNRQHKFRQENFQKSIEKLAENGHTVRLSPSAQGLMDTQLEQTTAQLKSLIERMQGKSASIKQYKHWFPERQSQGEFFVAEGEDPTTRPKNCGSIEWLCKAVMARHTPDINHRSWWLSAYNNDYDLINLYTHPVMGYDDCFRGTEERLLDLAQMQISMRFAFHQLVLPPISTFFRTEWFELVSKVDQLHELDRSTTRTVLQFLWLVHQQDRETSPMGPNLWA